MSEKKTDLQPSKELKLKIPNDAVALADNRDWTNRFEITSETTSDVYTIAQHKTGRHWGCKCRGWIFHKKCKHLSELGLPNYQQPYEPRITRGDD